MENRSGQNALANHFGFGTAVLLVAASLVIAAPVAAAKSVPLPFPVTWILVALAIFACLVLARFLCSRLPAPAPGTPPSARMASQMSSARPGPSPP